MMTAFQEMVARSQPALESYGASAVPRYEFADGENTTERTARKVSERFGHSLTDERKRTAGRGLHYGFGVVMGAMYGVAAEYVPLVGVGAGAVFGTVLFAATDLGALPGLGLAKQPGETAELDHLMHWAAHVTYATAMESTRQQLRKLA